MPLTRCYLGTNPLKGYDLSSIKVLGSVGEPINPEGIGLSSSSFEKETTQLTSV